MDYEVNINIISTYNSREFNLLKMKGGEKLNYFFNCHLLKS